MSAPLPLVRRLSESRFMCGPPHTQHRMSDGTYGCAVVLLTVFVEVTAVAGFVWSATHPTLVVVTIAMMVMTMVEVMIIEMMRVTTVLVLWLVP